MADDLYKHSLHQLRSIAQGYGATNLFNMEKDKLVSFIREKQNARITERVIIPDRPEYDARLMNKQPSRKSNRDELVELLSRHTKTGLHLTFPTDETWHMRFGTKEDTGTIRQPLRAILQCAERVMRVK